MKKIVSFILLFTSFCFLANTTPKILINLNGGLTLNSSSFNDTWTGDYFKESFIQKNAYKEKSGYNIGIDISYLFMKNGGFNISMEKTFSNIEGEFKGEYPHPFYFNTPRTIDWEKTIDFNIIQTDINFIYGLDSVSKSFRGYAFFGVSFFQGKPAYLSSLSLNEVYPYNTISIENQTYNSKTYNSTGFNIGVSFYKQLVSKIAFGTKIKYSYGKFDVKREDNPNLKIPLQNLKVQFSVSFSL